MTTAVSVPPRTPLTPAEFSAIQTSPTRGDELARQYNLSEAYVSYIRNGKVPPPTGKRRSTSRGTAYSLLSLATYQAIRAVWNEGLRAIGLDPDHLPEDFTPHDVVADLRAAGLPIQTDIARQFNTSTCTVSEIVRGKRLHRDERGGEQ